MNPDNNPHIRVCVIEDQPIVRAGLRILIENQQGMQVVGEASNRVQALAVATAELPDVFLLDLDLGKESGVDWLPELISRFPSAHTLVLTGTSDTDLHQLAVAAGARGIVLKEHAPEVLMKAIKQVHSGDLWFGRSLTTSLISKLSAANEKLKRTDEEAEKIATLTPREKEVIQLVAQGLNGTRIASLLRISDSTVRNHLTSILDKLGLSNKFELAVYALKNKLAERGPAPSSTVSA